MDRGVFLALDDLGFRMIYCAGFSFGKFAVDQHVIARFKIARHVSEIPPAAGYGAGIILKDKLEERATAAKPL